MRATLAILALCGLASGLMPQAAVRVVKRQLRSSWQMHVGHDHSHSHSHSHSHEVEGLSSFGELVRPRPRLKRHLLLSAAIVIIPLLFRRRRATKLDLGLFVVVTTLLATFDGAKSTTKAWIAKLNSVRASLLKHSTPITARYLFRNENMADRVTLLGLVINVLLSISKLWGGIAFNSAVLVADAGHSFSDLMSDFITLWAVQVARLPADDDHPYGHGKFESVGSLFLSLTLIATGLSIGAWSYDKFLKVINSQTLFSAATGAVTRAIHALHEGDVASSLLRLPSWPALSIAAVSIASKEWLYQVTRRAGEALNSQIIIANAWHHRSDAFSSVLSFGSIAIAIAMPQLLAVDPAAGIFVAGMICLTGVDVLIESVKELVDTSDGGIAEQAAAEAIQGVQGVLGVKNARGRTVGRGKSLVELTVYTDGNLSYSASQNIAENAKWRIIERMPDVIDVSVRTSPLSEEGKPFCPLLGQQAVKQSPAEVEGKIRRVLSDAKAAASASSPLSAMLTVTRVTTHYLQEQNRSTHADVFLRVNSGASVAEARAVATAAQKAVLASSSVDSLDVFLDVGVGVSS